MLLKGKIIIIFTIILALLVPLVPPAQASSQSVTRFLPGDEAVSGAAYGQSAPSVAKGNDTLLVVWTDRRSALGTASPVETDADIWGMLLDANGIPSTATSFPVTQAPGAQTNPQISWNGTDWLVVFETYEIGGTGYYDQTLAAVRVSAAGSVLDSRPIMIHDVNISAGNWSVASDGNNWVVAFEGISASADLMAVRISPNGTLLDPPVHSFVPATYYLRSNFKLAYANGIFLLTWLDFYDTLGIRFDSNLNKLDATPISLVSNAGISDITSNDSMFYLVWLGQQPDFSMALMGERVSSAGQKLDGEGVKISGNNPPQVDSVNQVVWDGTNWRATWGFNDAVQVARIDTAGTVLEPGGIAVNGPTNGQAAATPAGGVQLVWAPYEEFFYDVITAQINADFNAGLSINLSTAAPAQLNSEAASSGNGYVVVYRSDNANMYRILASALDASGNPLAAEPVQLDAATPSSIPGLGNPAIAWNGTYYLVAWANSAGIVAIRLDANGEMVDPAPFTVLANSFGVPNVAAIGDNFLVAGRKYDSSPEFIKAIATRVRGSDGAVLDPTPITVATGYVTATSMTVMGGRFLVAYESFWSHNSTVADTAVKSINTDGTPGPGVTISTGYSAGGLYYLGPAIASNGSTAFVVHSQELSSGVEADLAGRVINADFSLDATINLTPWSGNQFRPRLTWDGSQYVLAYQDQRNRTAFNTLDQLDARSDLFGMRISTSGNILDPQGFAFSVLPTAESQPTVASAGDGVTLILGSILSGAAPLANYRIGYDLLGQNTNAWPMVVVSATPAGGTVPLQVTFSSAGSTDPDGTLASYSWDFGDGDGSSLANPTHLYSTGGPFVVSLTLTDNQGAQTTNTIFVSATSPNQLPVAQATASPASGPIPLDVTLFATGSYDPDGTLGSFHWTFSDGGEEWGAVAYHTFNLPGPQTATLTVFDYLNASSSVTIPINSPNNPPVLNFIGNRSVDELAPLEFTVTAVDPDLPPQTLTFTLAPGAPVGASLNPVTGVFTWTPSEAQGPGAYPVTVSVTDDGTPPLSDAETFIITVNEVFQAIVVNAGPDQAVLEGQLVQFSGMFTETLLLGQPQAIDQVYWDFGDGMSATGSLDPLHAYGDNGSFTVTLIVTDTVGNVGSDSLLITSANSTPTLPDLPDQVVKLNQLLSVPMTFTDPGWLDSHTVKIDWDTGVTETIELAAGVMDLTLQHTYSSVGQFPVVVTVSDKDGGSDFRTFTVTVESYRHFLPQIIR